MQYKVFIFQWSFIIFQYILKSDIFKIDNPLSSFPIV